MKRKALLISILTFILIPNVLFAGIYKCVDGAGNISFATEPKPGCSLLQKSADSERLALLIGNSKYADGGSLPNPVNDDRPWSENHPVNLSISGFNLRIKGDGQALQPRLSKGTAGPAPCGKSVS